MPGFADSRVKIHQGVPTLFVNDQPLHGMTATSCAFDDPQVVRDFVSGGVEIMMIWIEAGIHCWNGPGQFDWSYAEKKLAFFEAHSGDTKWIIRVRLGLLNAWFANAFPGEVHNPPDGSPESKTRMSVSVIHSSVWLKNVLELIEAFTAWLKTTRWAPRIIGFMLNAGSTEEWLPFDNDENYRGNFHPVIRREFQNWLRREYDNNVQALHENWRDAKVDFASAKPFNGVRLRNSHIFGLYTLRDPEQEPAAEDFYRFMNETLADALIGCCRAAKTAAGTPIIAGGFHSYLWWETGVYSYIQEYGHGLIQRLNQSPWVDFVSDIASYDGRYPGGPSGYLGLPHSLNLHGKLHYTEVDLVTFASMSPEHQAAWKKVDPDKVPVLTAQPAIPDEIWKWNLGFCGRDEVEEIAVIQREHAHHLITGTPYWWFDIRSHNYQSPGLVAAMNKLSAIGREAVGRNRASCSEVAFVCSEDTPMHQSSMNGSLLRFEMESSHGLLLDGCNKKWGLAGMPYDIYELHDLGHPDFRGDQYKLIVFVNCAMIPRAAEAGIRRWQRDDRVLCWTFAAGVMSEKKFDPAQQHELLGIRLGCRRERRNIHVLMNDNDTHPLTRGGASLNFGTEGSIGPVFFADDPQAEVLAHLRDGGEPAFAVRDHGSWRSVYLSMLNFGPALLRNLAAYAGAHVWTEGNDVLYANHSMLCLHTASAGEKRIKLPQPSVVTDLWSGERTANAVETIEFEAHAYRTRIWSWGPG